MRINQYIAQATGISRRKADELISQSQVIINGKPALLGSTITPDDIVTIAGKNISLQAHKIILLNKPVGYVCSRKGQNNPTIYELIPTELHHLKSVGRLDKDSSGLLVLTNDGQLHHELSHPSAGKIKKYSITLESPLKNNDLLALKKGVLLTDGISKLHIEPEGNSTKHWIISISEGRNRQIRRTFGTLGYTISKLHRQAFGPYVLDGLKAGEYKQI